MSQHLYCELLRVSKVMLGPRPIRQLCLGSQPVYHDRIRVDHHEVWVVCEHPVCSRGLLDPCTPHVMNASGFLDGTLPAKVFSHVCNPFWHKACRALQFASTLSAITNAGKIGYETLTPGALDIVGLGQMSWELLGVSRSGIVWRLLHPHRCQRYSCRQQPFCNAYQM